MTSSNVNFYDDYCCSHANFVDEQNYRYQHHYSQRTVPAYRNVYAAEDEDDLHDLIVADGLSTDCRHHHYRGVLSQAADSSSATPPAIYSRDETTLPTKTSTTKRRQIDVDEVSRNPRHRQAANIRERRRMRSINEAFEHLRRRIPTLPYEKRLSKVDTLRLAIGYIKFLHDLIVVNNVDGAEATRKSAAAKPVKRPQPPEAPPVKKIIIQCHAPEYRHARDVTGLAPLVGHSLSWNRPVETSARPVVSPDGNSTYLTAKVWTPTPKIPANSERTPAVHDDPGPPELRPVDDYVTSADLCYQMIRANV